MYKAESLTQLLHQSQGQDDGDGHHDHQVVPIHEPLTGQREENRERLSEREMVNEKESQMFPNMLVTSIQVKVNGHIYHIRCKLYSVVKHSFKIAIM